MLRVIRHKARALVIADSAQRLADMRIENAPALRLKRVAKDYVRLPVFDDRGQQTLLYERRLYASDGRQRQTPYNVE